MMVNDKQDSLEYELLAEGKVLKMGTVEISGKAEHEWRKIYYSSVCGGE